MRRLADIPQKEDFLSFSPYIHPSVMFRKEVFEKYGLYNTSDLCRRCEDYELFIRLHRAGSYGCNLEEILLYYREEKDSYKKRTFQSRRREARLRRQNFPALGLSGFWAELYKYKPYGTAVIPKGIYREIKRRSQKKSEKMACIKQWSYCINQNREYLYILLLSLCRIEPIVSMLCSTNSHKMYKYS